MPNLLAIPAAREAESETASTGDQLKFAELGFRIDPYHYFLLTRFLLTPVNLMQKIDMMEDQRGIICSL